MTTRGEGLTPSVSRSVLGHLAPWVMVIDDDWAITFASDRLAAAVGETPAALIGRPALEAIPSMAGTTPHLAVRRAMQTRTALREQWYSSRLGLWMELRIVPLDQGLLLLYDDISEVRAASSRSERLVELGEALAGARDALTVNEIVQALAAPLLGAHTALIYLADEERGMLTAAESVGLTEPAPFHHLLMDDRTATATAYGQRAPVLLSSVEEIVASYPLTAPALIAAGQKSLAALPLTSAGATLGSLLITFPTARVLSAGDVQFLVTTAAMSAQALVRAHLIDVESRSIDALQRSLLPQVLPPVVGLETAVRYVASDTTAQIGGDWYDLISLPDSSSVGLVMGDVEGHDLAAAALMGLVRSAVRAYALDGHPPALVIERTNAFLATLDLGRIVTMTYAQLHAVDRLIITTSAGHLPTFVAAPDGTVTELPVEIGPPLGVFDAGVHWSETTSTLPEGALVALFTDGLVEVRGEDLDVGLDRVRAVLAGEPHGTADAVADHLLADRGRGHDDVALITARLTAPGGAPRRLARRLPPTPASVPLARAFGRHLLASWEVPVDMMYAAELVISELVTNAARHSEDMLEVALELRPGMVRVEVSDSSHRMPTTAPTSVPDDATSGRGLMLVEAMASRWGVESEGLSKLVWAEIDV